MCLPSADVTFRGTQVGHVAESFRNAPPVSEKPGHMLADGAAVVHNNVELNVMLLSEIRERAQPRFHSAVVKQ